jgi:basic membrane protein A
MPVRRAGLMGMVALAASVTLAGCGPAPDGGTDEAVAEDCARMVTNSGGLEDRSFNQSTWEGLQQAEDEYGIEADALVSTGETDLAP